MEVNTEIVSDYISYFFSKLLVLKIKKLGIHL